MKKKQNVVTVGMKMGKLEWQARFVVGKLRRGSSLTRNDQLNCLGKIGMAMQRFGLNNIKDIKTLHVSRYFAELSAKGMSAGRLANHATAMRMLCRMMGKSDIVPSNRELGCARDIANRTKNADMRLNVEKAADVRTKLSENNRIAYDMSRHFGLRQKEALLSHKTIVSDGIEKLVIEGAKGGRPREVLVITQEQREVLQRNMEYRNAHSGKLINEDKSLKQGLKEMQNVLAAVGATRQCGANMHSLRREWIIERCQEILASPEEARAALIATLLEETGHGREEVLRCYTRLVG